MAFIVTPGQLALRSELYHQLGALLSAGVPLISALETIRKNPPQRSLRGPVGRLLMTLGQGGTFTDAMRAESGWLPEFDVALLESGERSGRLDACFKLLAEYYRERAQLARMVLSGLAYPVFLMHFAVFITPFPQLFLTGNVGAYLQSTFGVLVPVYLVCFAILYASQSRRAESWRAFMELSLRCLPVLGKARQALALARLASALEALINAGISIINAWEMAAAASGSPAIRRAVAAWRPRLEHAGATPSQLLSEEGLFPEVFANLYHGGEVSGKLDDTLNRLHHYYQEEASRRFQTLAKWFPIAIYLVIVLRIALNILSFWSGYFQQISNAMGG